MAERWRLLEYTHDAAATQDLVRLIVRLYERYPEFAVAKSREVGRALSSDNPFFRFGQVTSFLLYDGRTPVAHCAAIVDRRQPREVGLVGFFECVDDTACAARVLQAAVDRLRCSGRTRILGPVQLTTWESFRVAFPEDRPPFLSEPFTRGHYRDCFLAFGFLPVQRNVTTTQAVSSSGFERFSADVARLMDQGFAFASVAPAGLPTILPEVHRLASCGFDDTWAYVPLSLEEFRYSFQDMAGPALAGVAQVVQDPRGALAGFCVGYPDLYARRARLVLKVMAVAPHYRSLGLGRALFFEAYQVAVGMGIEEFVFATMRVDNDAIHRLTGQAAQVYREYEVYELALE